MFKFIIIGDTGTHPNISRCR